MPTMRLSWRLPAYRLRPSKSCSAGASVFRRAATRTGADWWILSADAMADPLSWSLERPDARRLEVSGINSDLPSSLKARLNEKVSQLQAVDLGPGVTAVVGIQSATVIIRRSARSGVRHANPVATSIPHT